MLKQSNELELFTRLTIDHSVWSDYAIILKLKILEAGVSNAITMKK